jgi:hypothetical protein
MCSGGATQSEPKSPDYFQNQAARQLGSNGVEIAGCSPNCRVSNVQHVLAVGLASTHGGVVHP